MASWYFLVVFVWKSIRDGITREVLTARESLYKQNGLPPMVNIMQIAPAKSRSKKEACHQPAFMDSCLTISHTCLPCVTSR